MRLKLFFSALAVAAIALTGCNKQTELEINYGKTATLQGKVTIFDKDNSTSQVASGVKVYAEVAYADMISTTNPNGNKTFNTTTNEDGIYTFQLPVTETEYNNGIRLYTELKEIEGKFYIGEATVLKTDFSITPNDITYQNINMFSENMAETVITVKGTVEISGTRTTPAKGFEVNASINSKKYKTTTNSDGEYVFQLPYMASGSVSITVPKQEVDGKTYISNDGTNVSIDGTKLEYEANSNINVREQQ